MTYRIVFVTQMVPADLVLLFLNLEHSCLHGSFNRIGLIRYIRNASIVLRSLIGHRFREQHYVLRTSESVPAELLANFINEWLGPHVTVLCEEVIIPLYYRSIFSA
jgi:hypothetical protein